MKHKILFTALLVYLLSVSLLLIVSILYNKGNFVYVLDDPYIHMDIAKNFVEYGHWATNKLSFTSATSSPLWTLILSGIFFLTGVNVFIPFILNLIFGIAAIYIAYYIFKENNVTKYFFVFLILFIYITPMPVMLFTGMEHTAQIAVNLLFVYLACKVIIDDGKDNFLKYLLLITPFVTAIRYEGIFLIVIVAFILILRKKMLYACLILLLGMLPIIIYGLVSYSHGWYFLPNTILLKSGFELSLSSAPKLIYRAFKNITQPHIFLMLIAGISLAIYRYKKLNEIWSKKLVFLMIFVLTTIINMSLIDYNDNGWFYRYEAYLMAIGVVAIAIGSCDIIQDINLFKNSSKSSVKLLLTALVLLICSPLIIRALTIFLIPLASNNIYEQHYQIGQFVKNCDPEINIAANDIGMINLYSNNEIVDLWGLANMDAASLKIKKNYDTKKIFDLVSQSNVKLAILYEHWFDRYGGLPAEWTKIGEWTMTKYNLVCGSESVSFYAINRKDAIELRKKLDDYSVKLPKSVIYKIMN